MRTRRYSPEPFKSRCVTLTLTLGDLWGPTPFLPPLIGLSFQGPQTSPTPALHQLSLAGEGAVSRWLRDKGRGPSAVPDPLLEACAHCASTPAPAGSASLGLGARGQPRRRPRAASPAAPRKPQRCPAPRPASWKLRSRTHRAMAQPETGPSTSSGRIQTGTDLWAGRPSWGFRLPASGLAVSCE